MLSDTNPKITYTGGPYFVPNVTDQANGNGFPTCDPTIPAEQCDLFTLNVNVAAGDSSTKQIRITISWAPVTAADYDLFVYSGPYTNSGSKVIASNPSGVDPAVVLIPAVSGTYTIALDPFTPLGDSFVGTVTLETIPTNPPPATGPTPRYQTFAAPSSAGGAASSGEPSIGVDWNPNVAALKFGAVNSGGAIFFTSNFHEYRVDMDDCSSPAIQTWTDVTTPPETDPLSLDPIGFCDHFGSQPTPGRIFQSQLAGPAGSVMADSDNDGDNWIQSQGGGQPAGVDHQTVGAGPYNPNAIPPPPPHPLYPNAVYYCSQDLVTAFCARSDDGGATFGAGVAVWTLTQCGGIHGHVKVAPDGTVYVPNKGCGANQAVAVSTDNGLTWAVRPIPDSSPAIGLTDPSLGIATDGSVYFGYQDASGHPKIAVSHDRGLTWSPSVDAGVPFSIQNSTFPEVAAGDPARASFMFLGTPTGGNYQDPSNFTGIWHAYIATTLDGGKTYATVDATPTDPVQVGSICNLGTTGCMNNSAGGADRNMLDFMDLSIDSQGRAVGAFADGCVAGSCDASSSPSASRSALGTVVRQSGGPRLFAAFDPVEPALPGAPQLVSAIQMSGGTLLTWLTPDNGGSPITQYNIYRGGVCCQGNNEVFLKKVKSAKTAFFDTSKAAQNGEPYFYYVTAVNSLGEGPHCGQVESVPGLPPQSPCILPGLTIVTHPVGAQTGAPANSQLNINSISIAEPFVSSLTPNQLYITMKVQELNSTPTPQPNSEWNVLFTVPNGTQYFVDMNTEGTTPAPAFTYGHIATLATGGKQFVTDGNADSGSWAPDGTIRIVIADTKVGGLVPGDQLVSVNGTTQAEAGTSVTGGLLLTVDSTGDGRYILVGNQNCSKK